MAAGESGAHEHEQGHAHDPLDPLHLFGHVQDSTYFEVPHFIAPGGKVHLPQPVQVEGTLVPMPAGFQPLDLKLTRLMVVEVVAAIVVSLLFIRLANKIKNGAPPRGRFTNMLEAMVVYFRDEVARPAIGRHDAGKFAPFILTLFFFILTCNLLGLVPWVGTATGAFATTGALAVIAFFVTIGSGMAKLGAVGFWKAQVPHMDLPKPIAIFLVPIIFAIEILGLFIKHFVLSIRLLANMMAGHLVLAVIMAFILVSAAGIAFYGVMPASVFGAVALTMLELLVAFIQAYIFAFLAALFIGMAVHPH